MEEYVGVFPYLAGVAILVSRYEGTGCSSTRGKKGTTFLIMEISIKVNWKRTGVIKVDEDKNEHYPWLKLCRNKTRTKMRTAAAESSTLGVGKREKGSEEERKKCPP